MLEDAEDAEERLVDDEQKRLTAESGAKGSYIRGSDERCAVASPVW